MQKETKTQVKADSFKNPTLIEKNPLKSIGRYCEEGSQ